MAKPKALERLTVMVTRWRLRQRLLKHGAWPLCIAWGLLLVAVASTQLASFLDEALTLPFLFKTREMAGRDPPLHAQLRIFSYDDGSVDRLQRADLTIDDWATVLSAIAAQHPRLILIDKVFSILFDPTNSKDKALARLAAAEAPIVVGGFAVQAENKTRTPLDLNKPDYKLDSLLVEPGDAPPDFRDYRGWHVYGPHPDLQKVFRGSGHLLYPESGLVSAVLQPDATTMVPHMTLLKERKTWLDGALYVNGIKLPVDRRGRVIVNFSREDAYYGRHKRLGKAVMEAREGKQISNVEEGDTVLILPEMYTGSTDFKQTPIGILPGGFVLASMLNSVLSNSWIRILPWTELQIAFMCVLGAFWGYKKALRFWLGMVGLSFGLVALSIYLFASQSTTTAVPLHLAAFWGTSLIVFADLNLKREQEARRIAVELNDAAEMAKAFRPDPLPTWDFIEIASYHKPFSEASGDWFAFCRAPGGRFHHFMLCDVTGHGVQAALMVCICKTVLALYTRDRKGQQVLDAADFMSIYSQELNAMLFHHGRGRHLLTLLGITFDAETNEVHYLSAGHPPPIVLKDNQKGGKSVRQVAVRSSLLGLSENFQTKLQTQKIVPGDEIVTYTDGLPVGHHVRALNQFVNAPRGEFKSAPESLLHAVWAAETRKTGKMLDDDVSIIWFRLPLLARPTAAAAPDSKLPATS